MIDPALPSVPAIATALPDAKPPLLLLLVLSGLMSFGSLSTDMYLPSLPTLGLDFAASSASVQFTLTSFLLGFCGGQLVWGPIGDQYGRRMPAAVGLALFVVGSAGCAWSGSIHQMILWRAFQAFGASAGPVLARAMVRDLYTKNQAARMLSVLILVMGVAPLLGPILGGQVLVYWTWQGIFWVQTALGLAGLGGLALIRETQRPENRSRLSATEMIVGYGELLKQPRLLGYGLSGGCFYGAAYAYLAGSPFVYIVVYHVPAQLYGWLFGLNICGMMAMNAVNSRLVMTVGSDRMLRLGLVAMAAAGAVLAVDGETGFGGLWGLVAPTFVLISMNGAVVANSIAGALSAYPRKAGTVSALVGAVQFAIGVFSTAVTGWFADAHAFAYAWVVGLMTVCGLASNLLMIRPRRT